MLLLCHAGCRFPDPEVFTSIILIREKKRGGGRREGRVRMRGRQFFKASNFLQVSLMFSPALLQYTPFSLSHVYI